MKKLLAIIVLGLLWSGNAYAKKPIIQCTIKDGNIVVGKVVYDLNDSKRNFITEYSESVIRWNSYTNTGDKKIHFVNRLTGTYSITLIDPARKEHSFRGSCVKGSLKQKF
jgi:hypothetical protein